MTMTFNFQKLFFCTTLLICTYANAQTKWELKKNQDGIAVYNSTVEGSSFKAFRGVIVLQNTSLSEAAAIILDVSIYKDIFPDTREAKLIKQISDGHNIHYIRTAAPWPVDDRDGVYELTSNYLKEQKLVKVYINCIKSTEPVKTDVVRMQKGAGVWDLKEIKPGTIEMSYNFHGEPGGNIPAWLANSSVINIPFKTLQNIRATVATGKYKKVKVDFLE